jgi:ParB-like chromosome segregation protein Spo0J
MDYEIHEVANIFPMMSNSEFAGLVEDIQKNGQRESIWLHQGKIIDGRNRYKACSQLGIEPKVKEWDGKGSMVDFIVSMNFHRRNMDESQRAMVGAKIKHIFEEDARKRMLATQNNNQGKQLRPKEPSCDKGTSAEKAAKMVNSSNSSVKRAFKVVQNGVPELVQAVETGKVSVTRAYEIAKLPEEKQSEVIQNNFKGDVETKRKEDNAVEDSKPTPKAKSKSNPFLKPYQYTPPLHVEAPVLQKMLEDVNMTVMRFMSEFETELYQLEEMGDFQYKIGAYVDAFHKHGNKLEALIELKKGMEKDARKVRKSAN